MPEERWLLWAGGPKNGPAVLFWGYLLLVLLCAFGLGSLPNSPLRRYEWVLLGLGLTQVPFAAVLCIVGWLFALSYREKKPAQNRFLVNAGQIGLGFLTVAALACLAAAVHTGLVVRPDMQVAGMDSTNTVLRWYQDRTAGALPAVQVFSVPLWVYKCLMLVWALWLAQSLLRWLRWGFRAFRSGQPWRKAPQNPKVPVEDIEAAKASLAKSASSRETDAGDS